MKLNYDCMRDILLFYEENLDGENDFRGYDTFANLKTPYDETEVYYSIEALYDLGYIDIRSNTPQKPLMSKMSGRVSYTPERVRRAHINGENARVNRITIAGHDYLNSVRDPKIWGEFKKKVLPSLGEASLDLVKTAILSFVSSLR